MKSCDFTLFWLRGKDLQWHCIATPQKGKQRRVPPAASQDSTEGRTQAEGQWVIWLTTVRHITPWQAFKPFPRNKKTPITWCFYWLRGADLNH